jgi:hypothetical protein
MVQIGRWLIIAGIGLVVIGAVVLLLTRVPGLNLGSLPGDFSWKRGNVRIYAPIGTMLLVSIVLTIIVNLLLRLFK